MTTFLFAADTAVELEDPTKPEIRMMAIEARATSTDGHLQLQRTRHRMSLMEVTMPQNKTVHRVDDTAFENYH